MGRLTPAPASPRGSRLTRDPDSDTGLGAVPLPAAGAAEPRLDSSAAGCDCLNTEPPRAVKREMRMREM
jgi:hypothetical protein